MYSLIYIGNIPDITPELCYNTNVDGERDYENLFESSDKETNDSDDDNDNSYDKIEDSDDGSSYNFDTQDLI